MMKKSLYYQPHTGCLEYTYQHSGICKIPSEQEKREEKRRRKQELFASLDDDDEVMFGFGVEDY